MPTPRGLREAGSKLGSKSAIDLTALGVCPLVLPEGQTECETFIQLSEPNSPQTANETLKVSVSYFL